MTKHYGSHQGQSYSNKEKNNRTENTQVFAMGSYGNKGAKVKKKFVTNFIMLITVITTGTYFAS